MELLNACGLATNFHVCELKLYPDIKYTAENYLVILDASSLAMCLAMSYFFIFALNFNIASTYY